MFCKPLLLGVIALCLAFVQPTKAAAISNGELLKFYPISSQQYRSLLDIIQQQQPVVTEDHILREGHRAIAGWSRSLPRGWSNVFNISLFNRNNNNRTAAEKNKAFPLCILNSTTTTTNTTGRRSRQYEYDYAGVAPNVIYESIPQYPGYQPYLVTPNSPQATNNGNVNNGNDNTVVNCVVVLKRNQGTTDTATSTLSSRFVQPVSQIYQPQPSPYGYPNSNYYYGYQSYGTPEYTYAPQSSSRQIESSSIPISSSNTNRMYQSMLDEYYRQLNKLYLIHATRSLSFLGEDNSRMVKETKPEIENDVVYDEEYKDDRMDKAAENEFEYYDDESDDNDGLNEGGQGNENIFADDDDDDEAEETNDEYYDEIDEPDNTESVRSLDNSNYETVYLTSRAINGKVYYEY